MLKYTIQIQNSIQINIKNMVFHGFLIELLIAT
ncbi:MAG: hypothetical protein DRI84_05405 [Bacteroidetes bacterium]|nr:MAG: hypothetical protein DRI84_05405 [Bacteroidota bacterium]